MTRASPATLRTLAVLDFLSDHPGQSFTLTEIARTLRINPPTCLTILAGMVERGYLFRDGAKAYHPGPALTRLAGAAQPLGPLPAAMPEMRRLADEFGLICSAIFLENGVAVVRERATSVSHIGWATQLDRTFPARPPFGSIFMAWSDEAAVSRWIRSADPTPTAAQSARIRASLAFARTEGFSLVLRTEPLRDPAHAQALSYRVDKTDYLVSSLEPDTLYQVASVVAPVFEADGSVACALALTAFVQPMTGQQVRRVGRRLRASCDAVTRAIGGQEPAPVAAAAPAG